MNMQHIAQVCHEANRAYGHTVGDFSIPDWVDAPADVKERAFKDTQAMLDQKELQPDSKQPTQVLAHAIVSALRPFVDKKK